MPVTLSNISAPGLCCIEAIAGAAERICTAASEAGLFVLPDGHDPAGITRVREDAKRWLSEAESCLPQMTPGEALRVINLYDVVHRIAWSRPADWSIIKRYTLTAFEAFIRGDKTVDKYILFRQIAAGIRRKDRAYMDRPLQWYTLTLKAWYREFSSGTTSTPLSDHDTRERVSILLQSDLGVYETRNEATYKRRLLINHRHLLTNLAV